MVKSEFWSLSRLFFTASRPPQPISIICRGPELISSLDLSILKMAAEEAIAEVREEGYVGVLINACRDAAQQYV